MFWTALYEALEAFLYRLCAALAGLSYTVHVAASA